MSPKPTAHLGKGVAHLRVSTPLSIVPVSFGCRLRRELYASGDLLQRLLAAASFVGRVQFHVHPATPADRAPTEPGAEGSAAEVSVESMSRQSVPVNGIRCHSWSRATAP